MHRCYQFSLRSLFALMLAVAAYCGGWTAARKNVEREMEEARQAATEAALTSTANARLEEIWTLLRNRSDGVTVELP